MIVIGDVHGRFEDYTKLIRRFETETTVQIGDMGIFNESDVVKIKGNNYFFRGNHDNPKLCNRYTNCLGDYGYFTKTDVPFFYVAGAWSIDRCLRTEGVDWWNDEELSIKQLNEALDLYSEIKPDVMLTHECPISVSHSILGGQTLYRNRTGQALQAMFDLHQPKFWLFGHYHKSWKNTISNTQFVCINACEYFELKQDSFLP